MRRRGYVEDRRITSVAYVFTIHSPFCFARTTIQGARNLKRLQKMIFVFFIYSLIERDQWITKIWFSAFEKVFSAKKN